MKTLFTILISIFLMSASANNNKYQDAMSSAIKKMNSSETISNLTIAANTFERISLSEKDKWLPLYYTAYSYIQISYQEQDISKKDPYLDKAQEFIDKALIIAPEESEIYALQAFLYPSRMTVDPMARGMEYMGIMNQVLDKTSKLNPENPRSYYLRAIILLNTPESFGGGSNAAKPLFEIAQEKFDNFKPATPISPVWGKEHNKIELNKF
jgi:hypothetical protein